MTSATYALAVVRPTDIDDLPAARRPLGDLRALPAGDLAVVVCDVDDRIVTTLERDDLSVDDIAPLAVAHDDALCALAASRAVVPLRVGTVVDDDADVPRLVAAEPRLKVVLDRVTGHQEWTVDLTSPDPTAAPSDRDEAAGARAAGRDYLRAARNRLQARDDRRRAFQDTVAAVVEQLERVASGVVAIDRAGDSGRARLACLVRPALVERLERTARDVVVAPVDVSLHGPYPPYHFVESSS